MLIVIVLIDKREGRGREREKCVRGPPPRRPSAPSVFHMGGSHVLTTPVAIRQTQLCGSWGIVGVVARLANNHLGAYNGSPLKHPLSASFLHD